jgi:hypothetical protein
MALALKQLIHTYEEQALTSGMTPQLEIQLERLRAQLQTSEVGRAKADEAEAKKESIAETNEESGREIVCRACDRYFFLKESESAFFLDKGLSEPTRCFGCRKERKAARHMISCQDCEEEFEFSPAEQAFYTKQGWDQPKRCAPCRATKKTTVKPQTLSCAQCKKGFTFSVGSQKHFTTKGWNPPTRCVACRKAKPVAAFVNEPDQ